ncbi:Prolyl oligopeptidase family protein [compost metagenome]
METLKHVPVWAFHGAEDDVVPLEEAREVVDALQSIGGNAHMTVYPDGKHDAWTETYQNPGLYEWFLKNSL